MTLSTADDISIVYSGGTINIDPSKSLGGDPSSTPVNLTSLNNLFRDVTQDDIIDGLTDYRCFYLFNDGPETVYNIDCFILSQEDTDTTVLLGVENKDEIQRVIIGGDTATGGSLVMSYDGEDFAFDFSSDLSEWATNFQTALNSIEDADGEQLLRHTVVTAQLANDIVIFDVLFTGQDGQKTHPLLTLESNILDPIGSVDIDITVLTVGSPVNTAAPSIDVATTSPSGVSFQVTDSNDPINIPKLRPGDGFPMWIYRSVPAGSDASELDGGIIRFAIDPLDPFIS